MKQRFLPSLLAVVLSLGLAACEKPAKAPGSAVVATVGNEKITEAELDFALSKLGHLSAEDAKAARAKLLEAWIDQHLAAQAAKKAGLDKQPNVAMAVEQAQRQILAEAYAESRIKDLPKPTEAEIVDYFNKHPELFSQRRIFRIQELDLDAAGRSADIENQLKQSASLGDFIAWLQQQGIHGSSNLVTKTSEQIPAPLLQRLLQMKEGQVSLLPGKDGHVVVQQLQASQPAPVTLEQARGAIERILLAQKRKAVLDAELKKLREATKIQYAAGYGPAPAAKPADAQPPKAQ
jgi:EpsD family peptidyl-prolyl cis-trans isomerase